MFKSINVTCSLFELSKSIFTFVYYVDKYNVFLIFKQRAKKVNIYKQRIKVVQ